MRPDLVPDRPTPSDPRDFHAALWGFLISTVLASMLLGLAVGAAIRWAGVLPAPGRP